MVDINKNEDTRSAAAQEQHAIANYLHQLSSQALGNNEREKSEALLAAGNLVHDAEYREQSKRATQASEAVAQERERVVMYLRERADDLEGEKSYVRANELRIAASYIWEFNAHGGAPIPGPRKL